MPDFLAQTWPWYVSGPLIGLTVPLLLLYGGKRFGISQSLRHLCSAAMPDRASLKPKYLRYEWRKRLWNLVFVLGIFLGGLLAVLVLGQPDAGQAVSEATRADLGRLGLTELSGLVPSEVISWQGLGSAAGLVMIVGGGFLVGFGARYAGGCTSGHGITGLAALQWPSLVAVAGFFVGGLVATHLLLPLLLG
jgi:uncharacterized protein